MPYKYHIPFGAEPVTWPGQAYAALVSKNSVQFKGLMLVEPNNADASYLVHKLEGTQGGGAQVPLGKPALKAADFALVHEWIQAGAADAQATATDTGTVGGTSGNTDDAGGDDTVDSGDLGGTTLLPNTLAGI